MLSSPWLVRLSLVLLGVGFWACKAEERARSARGPIVVDVGAAAVRDVPVRLEALGTVEAIDTVRVISQVTGLIQQVHFKEGESVKKGDLLFSIDTRPYASSLAAAQADVAKNRALAEKAREDAERAEKLNAQGLTSTQELTQARAAAAAAEATLRAGQADVASASLNVQYARIRAPIAGRTGSLLVVAGNVVKANENQPLVVIRSLVPIRVRFAVPEENLSEIQRHMREGNVTVTAIPRGEQAQKATGRLVFLENSVDATTGTIDLKAEFANEQEGLWPGQFVDVAVELGVEKGATVVPEAAIQIGQEGSYAFVMGNDGKAHLRQVVVGRTIDGSTVIRRGVAPGEQVVTDGLVKLKDGAPVRAAGPATSASRADGAPR